jgi:ABC-2 type transport system permease protein
MTLLDTPPKFRPSRPSLGDAPQIADAADLVGSQSNVNTNTNVNRVFVRQLVAELKQFLRDPQAAGFLLIFPLFFLMIFSELQKNVRVPLGGTTAPFVQGFMPALLSFALISACFVNLSITLCMRRHSGELKRKRSTPLKPTTLIAAMVAAMFLVSSVFIAILSVIGVVFYHVSFAGRLFPLVAALVVGSACFSTLGLALSTVIPNANAAPPVAQGVVYPIAFISGTFLPVPSNSVLHRVGGLFPVRHLNDLMHAAMDPVGTPLTTQLRHIVVLVAWTALGAIITKNRFRWEARKS